MLQQIIQPNKLPLSIKIFDINHLSSRLNFPLAAIQRIIETKESQVAVFTVKIPKKGGSVKERKFFNPSPVYKALLKRINAQILDKAVLAPGVCGGIKGKTINDMVDKHCAKEAIYKIDLENFYPNITEDRIFKLFITLKTTPTVAAFFANLVTFDGILPQGFPTSTMIANIVASKLDWEHLNICRKAKLFRTRWIDDIAFSGRIRDLEQAVPAINTAVKHNGFKLNKDKCHLIRRSDKNAPSIIGLTVHKHKPYIPEKLIETIETVLIAAKENIKTAKYIYKTEFPTKSKTDLELSIRGKIKYIARFNKIDGERLLAQFQEVDWQRAE